MIVNTNQIKNFYLSDQIYSMGYFKRNPKKNIFKRTEKKLILKIK